MAPLIHQHVRSLRGIETTLYSPAARSDSTVLSLGAQADRYLLAHGYNMQAWQRIAWAHSSASGDPLFFEQELCQRGMPQTEVRYLWDLIDSSASGFVEV